MKTTATTACTFNKETIASKIIVHNNVGIKHIKRNECNDAIRHFKLALKYIKAMVSDTNQDDHDDDIPIASYFLDDEEDDIFSLSTMTMTFGSLTTTCSTNSEETKVVPLFQPIRLLYQTIHTVSVPPWNNNDKVLEIMTAIILYNMATCNLGIVKESTDDSKDDRYKESLARSLNMLKLSYGMIQDMLSSFTNIDINSIQVWYGIHQIEYRVLNAMLYVVFQQQHNNNNNEIDDLTPFECIMNHIQHVQQVLDQYKEMIHFLCTFSNTIYAAECA